MRSVNMNNIGFLMENGEEIWFDALDVPAFEFDMGTKKIVKINDEYVEFETVDWLNMSVCAHANHTYNSFGMASEKTNFNRLLECPNIVAVLMCEDETSINRYYCEDDVLPSVELDLEGNLDIILVHEEDVMDVPCECECCCEDTVEF